MENYILQSETLGILGHYEKYECAMVEAHKWTMYFVRRGIPDSCLVEYRSRELQSKLDIANAISEKEKAILQ